MNYSQNMGMNIALKEAQKAFTENEVPVGACLIHKGVCIARDHNRMHASHNPLLHAECLVIHHALSALTPFELRDSTLYVTLEPCRMCAGAIELVGIQRVFFGAYDPKMGNVEHHHRAFERPSLQAMGGFYERECQTLLHHFFKHIRTSPHKDRT